MAGMNFIGSYSGIDKTTIDQLMAAEKFPLIQLSNKKTSITEKQNAWKDINTRLNSLFEKVKSLQNKDTFDSKTSSSTNDKNVSMTVGKSATDGVYEIKVTQLATNASTIFGKTDRARTDVPLDPLTKKYSNTKDLEIDGSFVIKNKEGDSATIEVKTGDSLQSIVNNINNTTKDSKVGEVVVKGTGISATIVDNRLVLTDTKTGEREITLSGVGNTLADLGLDYTATESDKKASNVIGIDATFTINGVDVISSSNTVTNVVEGVTINLIKAGETDTVTIGRDNTVLTEAVQEFVEQYNSTMNFIEEKLKAGDPEIEGSKGALSGDSSLMRLHSSLRNLVTSTSANSNTDIKDISQLGITTIDKFGQLQFDASKLTKALSENPENVMNFFTSKEGDKEIGFAPRLKGYVDGFISTKDGAIKGKTESFDRMLKDLTKQIDNFSARMVKKEAYYIKKFSALDVALMQAESQMSWLQGQVDSMNGIKK